MHQKRNERVVDLDPRETAEWIEALDQVIDEAGPDRAAYLLEELADRARAQGAGLPNRLKAALKTEGRATNSYLFTGANTNALIAALDPAWPGPAPHTVLVGPAGNVIWRHNGPVNGDELRAKVLEYMGEYYKP